MYDTEEEKKEYRKRRKKAYGEKYDEISEALFKHDPIGINYEGNIDEYDSEAGMILVGLKSAKDVIGANKIIYDIFVKMFDEKILSHPALKERFSPMVVEVWEIYQR